MAYKETALLREVMKGRTLMKEIKRTRKWRSSQQLKGVRSQLVAAINACTDGAHVMLDMKSARNLVQVCDQAIHTEVGQEPTLMELENERSF